MVETRPLGGRADSGGVRRFLVGPRVAAGVLRLGTALAGFHDLAEVRRAAGKASASKVVLPPNVRVQL
jgi:hypothetical protein